MNAAPPADAPTTPADIVAACLADLARNVPAEEVVGRLRAVEPAIAEPALRARFLRARGTAANRLGLAGEALGDLHEARRVAEAAGDVAELVAALRALAVVYNWRGEGREAALALLRAVAECAVAGDRDGLALALVDAGRLQIELSRPGEAHALFARALAIGEGLPERERQRAFVNRLQTAVAAGRLDEARAAEAETSQALHGAPARLLMLAALEGARLRARGGDPAGAAACVAAAERHVPEAPEAFERIEVAQVRAEVALAAGDAAAALEAVEPVVARYADDDLAAREVEARLLQAEALHALDRGPEAARTLAAALRRARARNLTLLADEAASRLATSGGPAAAVAPDDAEGGLHGRFVRRRTLGGGGYGKVMRAYDVELGIEVALKRTSIAGLYDPRERSRLLDAARTEVHAAARIAHPGIARVHALLAEEGDALLVQELVEGPTLRSLVGAGAGLPLLLDILARLAFSLAAVHATGVIHRDLKPENVILRGGDSPVIIDFGIALLSPPQELIDGIGTPVYMAPEQGRGQPTARSDLYALGVMAHELLAGQLPAVPSGRGPALLTSPWISRAAAARLRAAAVPADVARLVGSLLSPHPRWRPGTATAVGQVLARALDQLPRSP